MSGEHGQAYAGGEHRVCGRRRGSAGRLAIATDRLGRDRFELRRATRCQAMARGSVCRLCGRACTEDSFSAPFSFPFFSSSSSSISALTFVSTSSSRSYLLETFVDLTSPLRSVLLREFETIQSGSPYASNARWGQSVGPQTYGTECGARRRVGLRLWKLLGRDGPAVVALRNESGVG